MEAPERIWVNKFGEWDNVRVASDDIEYVRSDIVEAQVAKLEAEVAEWKVAANDNLKEYADTWSAERKRLLDQIRDIIKE